MTKHEHDATHNGMHGHDDAEVVAHVHERQRDLALSNGLEEIRTMAQKSFRWLYVAVGIIAIVAILGTMFVWGLAEDSHATAAKAERLAQENVRLSKKNANLIQQIDDLNRKQADAVYRDCLSRNSRAKVSLREFKRLENVAKKDGNLAEAKFWHGYVVRLEKQKLPPCAKPKPEATGKPVPTPRPVPSTTRP